MKNRSYIEENEIKIFADISFFSKDAILEALYWYGDKFHATINFFDSHTYLISLKPLENTSINLNELEFYLQKVERDLIDYELRVKIAKETQNIRDLLVAKAFANSEFDESPPGDISDPVGFTPISEYEK